MRHAAPRSARSGKRRGAAGNAAAAAAGTVSTAGEAQGAAGWHQLPYLLIVAGTVAALAIIRLGTQHLKGGTLVLAGVLLVAAVARLVLPDRRAGMLASRRRWLDVAIFAVFGVGLLVAGLAVPVPG